MVGTIIFYNLDNGSGLILSEEKDKYRFDISMWNDLDNLPSIGLKIEATLEDGDIKSIVKYVKKERNSNIVNKKQDIKEMILDSSCDPEILNAKLDPDLYSTKTVPENFIDTTMKKFFFASSRNS